MFQGPSFLDTTIMTNGRLQGWCLGNQLLKFSHLKIIVLLAFSRSGVVGAFAKSFHQQFKFLQGVLIQMLLQSKLAFQVLKSSLHCNTQFDMLNDLPKVQLAFLSLVIHLNIEKNTKVMMKVINVLSFLLSEQNQAISRNEQEVCYKYRSSLS